MYIKQSINKSIDSCLLKNKKKVKKQHTIYIYILFVLFRGQRVSEKANTDTRCHNFAEKCEDIPMKKETKPEKYKKQVFKK